MIGCEFQGKPQRDLPGRTLSDAQRATYMGVVRVASNPIGPIYNIANTLSSAGSGEGSRMFVQPVNPAVELGGIIRELVLRTVRP
jgi:predicted Fe-Mo cluster-binding NifX family protein